MSYAFNIKKNGVLFLTKLERKTNTNFEIMDEHYLSNNMNDGIPHMIQIKLLKW